MLRVFTGSQLPGVLGEVSRTLGDDACIVDVSFDDGRFEVLVSEVPVTVHPFHPPAHERLVMHTALDTPDPLVFGAALRTAVPAREVPGRLDTTPHPVRPPILALVGPTGAGKTTTLAKLATNPKAYGGRRVGVIGLDTYRVGAVEQLETYAELAGLRLEVVYEPADVDRALRRLVECDVVLVDTPGRGPRQGEDLAAVRRCLARLAPDEVHLALPASMMPHVLRRTMHQFRSFGVTHTLCTKLDECPLDSRVFDVVAREGETMRWYTDGQEVPADLHEAGRRVAAARAHAEAQRSAALAFA